MKLLTQNAKLKKTSEITGIKTMDFALPAVKTCPFAGECKKFCYAKKGAYVWPVVRAKHEANYQATLSEDFEPDMIEEIIMSQAGAIRIHSSGDFYNKDYYFKWLAIAAALPHVMFYAYTKSLPIVSTHLDACFSNFTLIRSFGGTHDHMINTDVDRHAKVFEQGQMPADYACASDNDHVVLASNHKIGLIIH